MIKKVINKQIRKTGTVKGLEAENQNLKAQVESLKIENENIKKQVNAFIKSRHEVQIEMSNIKIENEILKNQNKELKENKGLSIVDIIKKGEKIYSAGEKVKYLFCKREGSDKLIVTFPGFSDAGKFQYRYVRTLKDVNAHRLFLLDEFGSRGCYLLGKNRDLSVETVVISLIYSIVKEYNLEMKNVIVQGSSKGGWMALYYGIKYRFGHVIAGGPQTKMGDFLVHDVEIPENGRISPGSKVSVADYVAGGHNEEHLQYLDSLLYDLLYDSPEGFPEIHLHIGEGDFHYQRHINPFINELDKNHIQYHLDVGDYSEHNDLAIHYPDYLLKTLRSIDEKMIQKPK